MSNDNKWVYNGETNTSIPEGKYKATFAGVEDHRFEDTDKWLWHFKVSEGEHKDQMASVMTSQAMGLKTTARGIIKGLLDRDIKVGENVLELIKACVGKRYKISNEKATPESKRASVRQVTLID